MRPIITELVQVCNLNRNVLDKDKQMVQITNLNQQSRRGMSSCGK